MRSYVYLILLAIFMLAHIDMSNVFNTNTPTGGDIGSHYALLEKIDIPFYHFWDHYQILGVAVTDYYPPFAFWVLKLFSFLIHPAIVFKVMIVLLVISLPIGTYFAMRQAYSSKTSMTIALLSIVVFIQQDNYAYGANLLSIVSGEFLYSLGLLAGLFFWGSLYQDNWKKSVIFLTLSGLLHPVVFVVFATAGGYFFFHKRVSQLVKIYGVSALLLSWWGIPLLTRLDLAFRYVQAPKVHRFGWPVTDIFSIFPKILIPVFILLFLIVLLHIWKPKSHRNAELFLLFCGCTAFATSLLGWGVRYLPIVYITACIIVGLYLSKHTKFERFLLPNLALIIIIVALALNTFHISGTFNYVFAGHQNLALYDQLEIIEQYKTQNRFLSDNFIEFPRSSRERLFAERAHNIGYTLDAMHNHGTQNTILSIRTHKLLFRDHVQAYLDYLNIEYLFLYNPENRFLNNSGEVVFENARLTILKQNASGFITTINPEVTQLNDWSFQIRRWINNNLSQDFIEQPLNHTPQQDCEIQERIEYRDIYFNTTCPGQIHMVKIGYYPKWQSVNGEQIVRTTPSYMALVPETNQVHIEYKYLPIDWFGLSLTIIGIILLFVHIPWKTSITSIQPPTRIFGILALLGLLALLNVHFSFFSLIPDSYTILFDNQNIQRLEQIKNPYLIHDKIYYLALANQHNLTALGKYAAQYSESSQPNEKKAELYYTYYIRLNKSGENATDIAQEILRKFPDTSYAAMLNS